MAWRGQSWARPRVLIVVLALAVVGSVLSPALPAAAESRPHLFVYPYYVYPSDQSFHQEYVDAINNLARQVRKWYRDHAGVTFDLQRITVVKSPDDYLTMRCGPAPRDPTCVSDRQRLDNWWAAEQKATGGFVANRIAWVFGQGGGGFAGSNLIGEWAGFSLLGDWTLEPISGVAEPSAIPCIYADWQCQGGAPKGAAAHELGHSFGLHHPDCYPDAATSLMGWHGDFPDDLLFPWEINNLQNNPYLRRNVWRPGGPWLDFANDDFMYWGETKYLFGHDFLAGDTVQFTDASHSVLVAGDVLADGVIRVEIPRDIGPGFIRVVRDKRLRSNIVPVNFYEHRFGGGCVPLP